tara:strand:+ start:74 stop:484 length:411 start_codon:yes stop_codon:yes gene_type:complete
MTIKLKAKTFGPVFAFFDTPDVVQYASTEISERRPHPPAGTPVDMLLASLAYCMVKSVEWAAQNQGASVLPFSVKITGTKAPDLPGRVKLMEVTLIGKLVEDAVTRRQIVKLAKNICTVSNTLNCEISVATEPADG